MTDKNTTPQPVPAPGKELNKILSLMRLALQLVKAGEGEAALRTTRKIEGMLVEALDRKPGT